MEASSRQLTVGVWDSGKKGAGMRHRVGLHLGRDVAEAMGLDDITYSHLRRPQS